MHSSTCDENLLTSPIPVLDNLSLPNCQSLVFCSPDILSLQMSWVGDSSKVLLRSINVLIFDPAVCMVQFELQGPCLERAEVLLRIQETFLVVWVDKPALDINENHSGSNHLEKQFATSSKTTLRSFLIDCREAGLLKPGSGLCSTYELYNRSKSSSSNRRILLPLVQCTVHKSLLSLVRRLDPSQVSD